MTIVSRTACIMLFLASMGAIVGCSGAPQPSATNNASQTPAAQAPKVTFRPEPDRPDKGKPVKLYVSLEDGKGNAVTDAAVKLSLTMDAMPTMNMPEMKKDVMVARSGEEYVGTTTLPLVGLWAVSVEVAHGGKTVASYRDAISVQ